MGGRVWDKGVEHAGGGQNAGKACAGLIPAPTRIEAFDIFAPIVGSKPCALHKGRREAERGALKRTVAVFESPAASSPSR